MDLLDKLKAVEKRRALFASDCARPGETVIERVLGPCEVVINGRPTLMFGSNNYLGLTLDPAVVAAARDAILEYGTGTTGSRTANGTLSLHEDLEREFADWFDKRHALIFSTGYQANLSLIGGLCGADDVILIDSDSHASIYDATRQTASQVVAFRHNSPESLRKKLERLPAGQRNRLVVVEGLYSIRGDVAPLREIVDVCRAHGAYLLVDEAHSLGTFGPTGLGCAEAQGVLDRGRLHRRHVLEVAGGHRRRVRVGSRRAARAAFSRPGVRVHGVRVAGQRGRRAGGGARDSRASGASRSPLGEHQTTARRPAGARLPHRLDRVADRSDFHRRGTAHDRALAGTARRRALREPDRAARLLRATSACCARAARPRTPSSTSRGRSTYSRGWASAPVSSFNPAFSAVPVGRLCDALAQFDLGDDPEPLAQPLHAADKSLGRQLDVPPPIERQRPADQAPDDIARCGSQARDRLRHANDDRRAADRQSNGLENLSCRDRTRVADKQDLAVGGCRDGGADDPDDIVHVDEGVRGVRAADERQQPRSANLNSGSIARSPGP